MSEKRTLEGSHESSAILLSPPFKRRFTTETNQSFHSLIDEEVNVQDMVQIPLTQLFEFARCYS